MSYRVAINGLGRIGRCLFRVLRSRPQLRVVALNDLQEPQVLAHLLSRDSIYGPLGEPVLVQDDDLVVGEQTSRVLQEPVPARLPWAELAVDCVVDCTGRFRTPLDLQGHLDAGAAKVVLSSPPLEPVDCTLVQGVNDAALASGHRQIACASCTTHCLAPPLRVLHETFGVEAALFNTVHAYTIGQPPLDSLLPDLRRCRAAALNIIPTTTGATRALELVYPALNGRVQGLACRVPVASCSLLDLTVIAGQSVTAGEVNQRLRTVAGDELVGLLEYSEEPLVSTDILGNPHSCVLDAGLTRVAGDRLVRLVLWYDNEWGYASRMADLLERLAREAGDG
jgi:glyceraldehyde 3-phosphate dehydrogenase